MTKPPYTYETLTHIPDGPERTRAWRRAKRGTLVEPIPGCFISTDVWNSMPIDQQILEKICAAATCHRTVPLCSVSAAALLGVTTWPRFYKNVHFATDEGISTHDGQRSPFMRHFIRGSRVDATLIPPLAKGIAPRVLRNAKYFYNEFRAVNDTIGTVHGICVTSPLQTMFDIARQLSFEFALAICDGLARIHRITQDGIQKFLETKTGCRGLTYARYMLSFVRTDSDNGGESFARARMILAGFEIPHLQVTMQNPFYNPARGQSATIQNTKTLRVDFCWDVPKKDGTSTRIVAELDGRSKYTDSGILDHIDTLLKERDREGALSVMDIRIVRFQFSEASENGGASMAMKLKCAGVPMVPESEQMMRRQWLIEYAKKHRMKFE